MSSTIFERTWRNQPELFLYRNENVGVGIIADAFPKFPEQVVLIPDKGFQTSKPRVFLTFLKSSSSRLLHCKN